MQNRNNENHSETSVSETVVVRRVSTQKHSSENHPGANDQKPGPRWLATAAMLTAVAIVVIAAISYLWSKPPASRKSAESPAAPPASSESKPTEPKAAGPESSDLKSSESKSSDLKSSDLKSSEPPSADSKTPAPAAAKDAKPDSRVLKGKWLRTDGNYVIDIKQIAPSGRIDAAYLNPNPIHVSKAELAKDNAALKIFLELQDTGYPGCTYDLTFDPKTGQLQGKYFQAAQQQTYDVNFQRIE